MLCFQYYTDEDRGSQSLDSEGAPPVMSKGSYTNLYNSREDLALGDSAHSIYKEKSSSYISANPRGAAAAADLSSGLGQGRLIGGHVTSAPSSAAQYYSHPHSQQYPGNNRPSPGVAKRATETSASHMISQAPPTSSGSSALPSSGFIAGQGAMVTSASGGAMSPLASDAKYPTNHALFTDNIGPSPLRPPFNAQKSSSTGSLGMGSRPPRTAVIRTSPTLPSHAGVSYYPQGGVSSSSSGGGLQGSAFTGLQSQQQPSSQHRHAQYSSSKNSGVPKSSSASAGGARRYRESGYTSSATTASRGGGGAAVHSDTASQHRHQRNNHRLQASSAAAGAVDSGEISNVPGAIKRPMSFVKALEMSDQLQMAERTSHGPARHGSDNADDSAQYGSSYEISV